MTGLWEACFSNYHDYTYRYDRIYDGCYWTLDEETHVIAEQLRRRECMIGSDLVVVVRNLY